METEKATNIQKKTLPDAEVALFCEQASLILKSGVPLVEGMQALVEKDGESDKDFDAMMDVLGMHQSLADGLEAAGVFPAYMVQLVRIGDLSGKLEEVMAALANYYRRESNIKKSLKSAITYPLMLLFVLAAVIVVLITQVMPIFSRVFTSLGSQMDATMTGVASFGTTLGIVVMVLIGLLVVFAFALFVMYKTKGGEKTKSFVGRLVPAFARLFETLSREKFASAMSLMQTAGLPTEQALELAHDLPFDSITMTKLDLAAKQISEDHLESAQAMTNAKLFEPIHLKMLKAGYQAGQMDTAMERLAEIYEEQADDDLRRMIGFIEPTLVVVLAISIGGVLLSVMLPLASIMTSIL